MLFLHDLKIAVRSLWRVRALWFTVALTLALGIGANAAIFSVVRAVLLRPLANRDEDRLLYVRQSAPGLGVDNTAFSVPEIDDLSKGLKTITELGTFSEIPFTIVGLGTPREVPAGVVDGHYFEVMGLRPVLGRLLTTSDDGPNAAGAIVLTYRFWTAALHSDPERDWQDGTAGERQRVAIGDHRGGFGTVGALSCGNRDHWQRGDQPAPSVSHHGDRPYAPHDGGFRPACPRCHTRGRAIGVEHTVRGDHGRTP